MPYNQYPLAPQARGLSSLGRYGDSMLVHMRPDEVAGLASIARSQGGSLSINPNTGLVEAWGIKSITKPFKSFADNVLGIDDSGGIAGSAAKILKPLGPAAPILASFVPGYGPILAATIAGLQSGEDGKAFNFKRAATAYAMSQLAQGAKDYFGGGSATFGEGAPAGTDIASIADAGIDPAAAASASTQLAAASVEPATTSILDTITNPQTYTDLASKAVDPTTYTDLASSAVDTITNPQTYSDLASGAWDYAKEAVSSPMEALKTAAIGTTAYSQVKTLQELEKQKEEAEKILADQAAAKASDIAWAEGVLAQYPLNYRRLTAADVQKAASGGLMGLARGGVARYGFGGGIDNLVSKAIAKAEAENPEFFANLRKPTEETAAKEEPYRRLTATDVQDRLAIDPYYYGGKQEEEDEGYAKGGRFLQGPGDGTSDSIPATIEGGQEARLADGEFVVDARTVSELGNGSSKAGAKKLYEMMDRVHAARRSAKRGKPSKADRFMPA